MSLMTMVGSGKRKSMLRYRWRYKLIGVSAVFLVGLLYFFIKYAYTIVVSNNQYIRNKDHIFDTGTRTGRNILAQNGSEEKSDFQIGCQSYEEFEKYRAKFPGDLFNIDQLRQGAVTLHVLGVMYMFVALAYVCDEFFVPALGVITRKLDLSEDVAGATFMAAGGSAPEFFTNFFGVLFANGGEGSNVGIGTIVGSAVFNILFVIGMCSFFSKGVLTLTWWPLFRDVCFYSTSLIVLVLFFNDSILEWWESLLLFVIYLMYVTFMKFNVPIEATFKRCLGKCRGKELEHEEAPFVSVRVPVTDTKDRHMRHRKSIAALMMHHPGNPTSNAHLAAMELHDRLDAESSNRSANRVPINDDRGASKGESRLTSLSGTSTDADLPGAARTASSDPSAPKSNSTQAKDIHVTVSVKKVISIYASDGSVKKEIVDEEETPLDMSFPDDTKGRIMYVLTFPILFLLWVTLPDVRRPEKEKWFACAFVGSILWIAVYSYLMVNWAETASRAICIPTEVMGLTILAAGTSVPDLITSVIVAKKGFGDMAVSSSVGSNLFDITVGLPVPWMIYSLYYQRSYEVSSVGLLCSIGILFLMLVAVVFCIAVFDWKMHWMLGVAMMILYLIFLTFAVLLVYEVIPCPDLEY